MNEIDKPKEEDLEEEMDEDIELRVKLLIALHHETLKRRALYPHATLLPMPNLLHLLPRKLLGRARIYKPNPVIQLPQYFKPKNPKAEPNEFKMFAQTGNYVKDEVEKEAVEEIKFEERILAESEELLLGNEEQEALNNFDPFSDQETLISEQEDEETLDEQSLDSEPDELLETLDLIWIDPKEEIEGFYGF